MTNYERIKAMSVWEMAKFMIDVRNMYAVRLGGVLMGISENTVTKWLNSEVEEVVDVVRCKNCKHFMFSDMYGECSRAHLGIVRPDDFCSYGERKEK